MNSATALNRKTSGTVLAASALVLAAVFAAAPAKADGPHRGWDRGHHGKHHGHHIPPGHARKMHHHPDAPVYRHAPPPVVYVPARPVYYHAPPQPGITIVVPIDLSGAF